MGIYTPDNTFQYQWNNDYQKPCVEITAPEGIDFNHHRVLLRRLENEVYQARLIYVVAPQKIRMDISSGHSPTDAITDASYEINNYFYPDKPSISTGLVRITTIMLVGVICFFAGGYMGYLYRQQHEKEEYELKAVPSDKPRVFNDSTQILQDSLDRIEP